jgi:hypothetical protein
MDFESNQGITHAHGLGDDAENNLDTLDPGFNDSRAQVSSSRILLGNWT